MYFYFSKILSPFLDFSNLLIIVILINIFFKKFFLNQYLKFVRNCLFILFFIISFFPIGKIGLNYLEKNYLRQIQFSNIDNIIVLAGSENIEATKISKKTNLNNSSERLIASVKLANEYQNAKLYFLGGDGNLEKNSIDESYVALGFYKDVDFDYTRVFFVNNTRNTFENLQEFKNVAEFKKKNILITSGFHMKRSLMIAKKLNIEVIPYAVDFRSKDLKSIINHYQFFSVVKNIQLFNLFFKEILGIIAVKILI